MKCPVCEDSSWVCEEHPQEPWDGEHACGCGAPGMPCSECNSAPCAAPRMPSGFKTEVDKDGRRH